MQDTVPEYASRVSGFHLFPTFENPPEAEPNETVASTTFLNIDVSADGSNLLYPGVGQFTMMVVYVHPGCEGYTNIDEQEDVFYLTVSIEDTITKVEIIESLDDPEHRGVNLVVWSKLSGEMPVFELLVVPLSANSVH